MKNLKQLILNYAVKVFMISGVISILGFFFEGYVALLLIIAPIMVGSIYLVVYSYFEYQKNPDNKLKS